MALVREIATTFRQHLLAWFRANRREHPWRRDRDHYRVWLAEVMLQQTRIAAVIPYYEKFLARFPDLQSLAEAPSKMCCGSGPVWAITAAHEICSGRRAKSWRAMGENFRAILRRRWRFRESDGTRRRPCSASRLMRRMRCLMGM